MGIGRFPVRLATLVGVGALLCPASGVAQRRVADVQVSPPDAQVQVGRTAPFVATAFDAAGNPIAEAEFVWTSSNPRVATIDRNGIATGVANGQVVITARAGSGAQAKSGHATLTVSGGAPAAPAQVQARAALPRGGGRGCAAIAREPPGSGTPAGLVVNPLRLLLIRGEAQALEYRALRADGQPSDPVCIAFSVDPGGERVASVDSLGVVLASGDTGRAVVRAAVPGRAGWQPKQIAVEVRADSVRFRLHDLSLAPGTTDTLGMFVPAQDRAIDPAGMFQFVSSDTSRVRVSPIAPIVFAAAPGTATVRAQSALYPDITVVVNVLPRVTRLVAATPDTVLTVAVGGTIVVGVRPVAADTTGAAGVPLRWSLSDTTVARLDAAGGTLRGLKAGEARLTVSAPVARDTSISRRWLVRVVAGGLAISPSRLGLAVGERAPISVELLDDRRRPVGPAPQLTWTSSNDSVARVVGGEVVGTGIGHARLTARASWDTAATADVFVVGDVIAPEQRNGRWDLYMFLRGDPSKAHPLTRDTVLESDPAWSPSLTQVGFVASASPAVNRSDLYVAEADGSEARRLTDDSAVVRSPSFVGPNGDQIVFESNRGGRPQLYVINRDGTGRRQLDPGNDPNASPDVSPDGRKVLFVSLRETAPRERHYNVYEVNLDGSGERRLTTSSRPEDSPAHAPDGRSFFYLRDEGGTPPTKRVYRQDLASGEAVAVTPPGVFVRDFSVSADGGTLLLTILRSDVKVLQASYLALFPLATGQLTPFAVPGAERVAAGVFRPPTPPPR
jgi:uncharacterized protein YjdB